jgi:hypothetical protein
MRSSSLAAASLCEHFCQGIETLLPGSIKSSASRVALTSSAVIGCVFGILSISKMLTPFLYDFVEAIEDDLAYLAAEPRGEIM